MSAHELRVGQAYVVHCPDRDGLRIGRVDQVDGATVTVRLRCSGRWWATPRHVDAAQVRREATAREVAVGMAIH